MRRQKEHLVSLLFLCVAYINKSIYIYIYELAVEKLEFFNNNIKKTCRTDSLPRFVPGPHNLQIKQCL